jgi:hypothetical protein
MNSGAPERWAVPAPKIVIIDNVNNFFGKPETAMIYITFWEHLSSSLVLVGFVLLDL